MDTRRFITTLLIVGVLFLGFNFAMHYWSGSKTATVVPDGPGYSQLMLGPVYREDDALLAFNQWLKANSSYYPLVGRIDHVISGIIRSLPPRHDLRPLGDPSKNSTDKLSITVDDVTACIEKVQLNVNRYQETANGADPLTLLQAPDAGPMIPRPFSTIGIHIHVAGNPREIPQGAGEYPGDELAAKRNDTILLTSQYIWRLEPVSPYEAHLHATFLLPGGGQVEVTKIFKVDPTSYDVLISHEVKNNSKFPVSVAIDQFAATDLPLDPTQNDDRFYHAAGRDSIKKVIVPGRFNLTHAELGKFDASGTREIGKFLDPLAQLHEAQARIAERLRNVPQDQKAVQDAGSAADAAAEDLKLAAPPAGEEVAAKNLKQAGEHMKAVADALEKRRAGSFTPAAAAELEAIAKTQAEVQAALANGIEPLEWVAASGRFFVAITRPLQNWGPVFTLSEGGRTIPIVTHIASAHIDVLTPPPVDLARAKAPETVGGIRLQGAPVDLKPGDTVSLPLAVYFGPKKSEILQGNIHADPTSEAYAYNLFDYSTVIQFNTGGCYTYCNFPQLGDILMWMLNFLNNHVTFHNYGLAIILLTIIIRAVLHPLTRASQVNMATMSKKMKDVQPLVEASKKKYAKDKQKQNEEMMRIYREHKVNPAGGLMGCLPMLIQMPIWLAMFSSLRTNIDLFHASFIPGWISDLSAPDLTVRFTPFHLPIMGDISGLNVLPLLLGAVFFVQMQVQTASQPKPADDQQAAMQNMTKYMSLLFPLFMYSQPSGLNLYYFASTMSGLLDTYFVRKTLKRKGILPANAKALPTHEEKS